ncbi:MULTISPECIES: DUF2634 domain-containing protein [Lactobacillus]|uniref:DUF2634 domain-containing protein n=1 Tax=Lactobacillus xujianguonis TaxID=2495899 RepID=A0A437SSV7_9LACO|nr:MULTISPECIES: DUF2634 domain-containing protein [Lactobacillus]RVU69937.1 DUF2634 domain-containing protein [Lactobacillus xujianguonis]RVU73464.1 DUF2634 domain-containing protein [Lactobacillus xujianguonis]
MAKDFEVTEYGDWFVDPETHDFVIIDGLEEIAQRIKATLETFYGEMDVLDPEQGMDYTNFLGHRFKKKRAAADLRRTIMAKVPEVDSVEDLKFDADPATRHLTVHFTAMATPTESDVSQEVEGDVNVGL